MMKWTITWQTSKYQNKEYQRRGLHKLTISYFTSRKIAIHILPQTCPDKGAPQSWKMLQARSKVLQCALWGSTLPFNTACAQAVLDGDRGVHKSCNSSHFSPSFCNLIDCTYDRMCLQNIQITTRRQTASHYCTRIRKRCFIFTPFNSSKEQPPCPLTVALQEQKVLQVTISQGLATAAITNRSLA